MGALVGVVGPSGVGKDTVMEAMAAARPGIHLVRRVITRAPDAGGEAFEGVSEELFEQRMQDGEFALHWRAHGLRYGVPTAQLAPVAAGASCLVNLSRGVLAEAETRFDGFVTLVLTAPADVLAARLKGRGRESADEIEKRLSRATFGLPEGLKRVLEVANDGALEIAVARALTAIDTVHEGRV